LRVLWCWAEAGEGVGGEGNLSEGTCAGPANRAAWAPPANLGEVERDWEVRAESNSARVDKKGKEESAGIPRRLGSKWKEEEELPGEAGSRRTRAVREGPAEGERRSPRGEEPPEALTEDLEHKHHFRRRVIWHQVTVNVKPGGGGGFAAKGVDGADEGGGGGGVEDLDLIVVGDFGLPGPVAVAKGLALDFLGVDLVLRGTVPFPKIGDGPACASGGGDSKRSLSFLTLTMDFFCHF